MLNQPVDNMGATFRECWLTSVDTYRGSMSRAIFMYQGGARESESKELSS